MFWNISKCFLPLCPCLKQKIISLIFKTIEVWLSSWSLISQHCGNLYDYILLTFLNSHHCPPYASTSLSVQVFYPDSRSIVCSGDPANNASLYLSVCLSSLGVSGLPCALLLLWMKEELLIFGLFSVLCFGTEL